MASRIYVQNLPPDITEQGLKDIFGQVGEVESIRLKPDPTARRPKASACVEMVLDIDAFRAVNCFQGATIKDCNILLSEPEQFFNRATGLLREMPEAGREKDH